jgi:CDP-4-dehydro-6-deoxyglucose reductase
MGIVHTTARLIEFTELAPDVRHFEFEVPEPLPFIPGQFVSFIGEVEGKRIVRAYSIASAPDGNRFALCLNRVQEGIFSPELFSLEPGDTVEMKGPYGAFTFREPAADSLLIATGTGIAPFRSMLLDRLPKDAVNRYTLIFGVRHEYGILYRSELENLASHHPNFAFWPTLTRPGPAWSGRQGRVQSHVMEAVGERRDMTVYVCGLRAMVDDVRRILKEIGFDRRQIVYERYD